MAFELYIDLGLSYLLAFNKQYHEGWGPPSKLARLMDRVENFDAPESIQLNWTSTTNSYPGIRVRDGYFQSPDQTLPLPAASRTAYLKAVLPKKRNSVPVTCIHLAGTGDSTYLARMLLARQLAVEFGFSSLILQNPYYGERSPSKQTGTQLPTVCDQLTMNIATIEEARSLAKWLNSRDYLVGLTGYSMGGFVAALTAQKLNFATAVVPCSTGHSAVYPLTRSPLAKTIDWRALQESLAPPDTAKDVFAKLFSRNTVVDQGQLPSGSEAALVAAANDLFINPDDVRRLSQHWNGAPIRWLDAGHTTGWAFHREALSEVIAWTCAELEFDQTGAVLP